jgi:hypothetical protein
MSWASGLERIGGKVWERQQMRYASAGAYPQQFVVLGDSPDSLVTRRVVIASAAVG